MQNPGSDAGVFSLRYGRFVGTVTPDGPEAVEIADYHQGAEKAHNYKKILPRTAA